MLCSAQHAEKVSSMLSICSKKNRECEGLERPFSTPNKCSTPYFTLSSLELHVYSFSSNGCFVGYISIFHSVGQVGQWRAAECATGRRVSQGLPPFPGASSLLNLEVERHVQKCPPSFLTQLCMRLLRALQTVVVEKSTCWVILWKERSDCNTFCPSRGRGRLLVAQDHLRPSLPHDIRYRR